MVLEASSSEGQKTEGAGSGRSNQPRKIDGVEIREAEEVVVFQVGGAGQSEATELGE